MAKVKESRKHEKQTKRLARVEPASPIFTEYYETTARLGATR